MTKQPDQHGRDPVIERLRNLPDVHPPVGLRNEIMASLSPKKPGWWSQLRQILLQPRTVTFVPIKWAPLLAGLLMLAVIPRLASIDSSKEMVAKSEPAEKSALTLTFEHPDAQKVALIGTFNRWVPGKRVRTEKQGNLWIFHLNVAPGRYEYAFLVDGQKVVPDPRAVFRRDNGFGTLNSIVYATANGHSDI